MAKFLCDLDKDPPRTRPGGQLTQAALDSYDKQLRTDQCPASTSIISYLKRLEMDQVIPSSSDQPDQGLTSDPSDVFIISKGHVNYLKPEPTNPPHSPQKLRSEVNSGFCSLIVEEYKPDETTYLPLGSSPHKASYVPSVRLMCTPPTFCSAERDIGDKLHERSPQIQRSLFNGPSEEPTKIKDWPKPDESSGGLQPALLPHLKNLRICDNRLNDQSALEIMSATSDWSIASFSTFTSHDEQDFRNGLAALDANIAKLQRTLQSGIKK